VISDMIADRSHTPWWCCWIAEENTT